MIIKDAQKVVDYFGMKLTVPNERGWISTDEDGWVCWYRSKPFKSVDRECWASDHGVGYEFLCTAHLDGMDWKDTLVEV